MRLLQVPKGFAIKSLMKARVLEEVPTLLSEPLYREAHWKDRIRTH